MNIKIGNEALDMKEGFSISIEENSPIFNDEGSQSISASVPDTPRNRRIFRFPGRLDTASDPNNPRLEGLLTDGAYIRKGVLNVTGCSPSEGISFALGFDNSTAYVAWKDRKLKDLSGLPEILANQDYLINLCSRLYSSGSPQEDDLAVFPVALSRAEYSATTNATPKVYWEMINVPDRDGTMTQPEKVMRLINNTPTEVKVPKGYGLSPFLRVWRVLELIFADLGVQILQNPFKDHVELARLTVLNNVADTICHGSLRYAELMPDCTVEEFMNALWVRFGLVFRVDTEGGFVDMKLLDDILHEPPVTSIDALITTPHPDITYEEKQYIKLSAATGIEGSAPACERFEDYIKGMSLLDLHVGADINLWKPAQNGEWEGEIRDEWDIEPEYPDGRDPGDIPDPWDDYDEDFWWDDRDDGRDEDPSGTRADAMGYLPGGTSQTWLGRETVTGRWWKLDQINDLKKDSSSGFFNWDPAPDDAEAMDLTSADEYVMVDKISIGTTGTANQFSGYAPAFLTGSRHYHSYIKGNDTEDESDGDNTPLAFMWAYHLEASTIGRVACENTDGTPIKLADGGEMGPTLYFQFADGLFANYWRYYDEILRHGLRTVEIDIRLDKPTLQAIDPLRPVIFRGCRCLIDKMEYSLPAGREVAVRLTLRTISTLGEYDIDKEQNIPAISMTAQGLGWALYECDWQAAEDAKRPELDRKAYLRFKEMLADREDRDGDTQIVVDPIGVIATGDWIEEIPTVLPETEPTAQIGSRKMKKFRGRIYYDCYMVRKVYDPDSGYLVSAERIGGVVAGTFADYEFDAVYVSTYVVRR